jgi:hypothetical protein
MHLKVRASTHEVIVKQQTTGLLAGGGVGYVPPLATNGPGIYFGEPNALYSTRIVWRFPGSFYVTYNFPP